MPNTEEPGLLPRDPSTRYTGRHHLVVLVAVLVFLVGLLVVRLVAFHFFARYAFQQLTWSDPLVVLVLGVASAAIVYCALRKDEGDFRALLYVATVLFAAQETLYFLANSFGALPFRAPAMMAAFASAFYSAVAVVASSFDHEEVSGDRCHKLATAGAFAVLVVSSLRFLSGIVRTDTVETCGTIVLALATVGLGFGLIYTYVRGSRPKTDPSPMEQYLK